MRRTDKSTSCKDGRAHAIFCRRATMPAIASVRSMSQIGHLFIPGGKPPFGRTRKIPADWAVVVTVTTAVMGPVPLRLRAGGEIVQVVATGRLTQPNSTT